MRNFIKERLGRSGLVYGGKDVSLPSEVENTYHKKLIATALMVIPFFSFGKCHLGETAFEAEVMDHNGFQQLCYVKNLDRWYFGAKGKNEKEYSTTEAFSVSNFTYAKDGERVDGYKFIIDKDYEIVLMTNRLGNRTQAGFSVMDGDMLPFQPNTIIYEELK